MKRALIFFGVILLASAAWTPIAKAATEAQKLAAIQGGRAHLDYIQCKTAGSTFGSWSSSGCGGSYRDAYTGMSIFAFLARVSDWPATKTATYQADIDNGMVYLQIQQWVRRLVPGCLHWNVHICVSGPGVRLACHKNRYLPGRHRQRHGLSPDQCQHRKCNYQYRRREHLPWRQWQLHSHLLERKR